MMTGRSRAPPISVSAPGKETSNSEKETDSEADFKAAWAPFDASFKSSITAAQFRQVMAGLGENVSDVEVDEILNSVDGEDRISCKSFVFLFSSSGGAREIWWGEDDC